MPRKPNYRKIKGRNKIRDGRICILFKKKDHSRTILAQMFDLTEERIRQILNTNHVLLPVDRELERKRQIWRIKNQIDHKLLKDPHSRKDIVEIEELYRKLLEEKVPMFDQSKHTHHEYKIEVNIDGKKVPVPPSLQSRANLPRHS